MNKVAFFSNYLNHHQLPFAKNMVELTNGDFKFISQKAISEKRISLGYKNISNDYDFVVKTYEGETEDKKAYEIADNYDYVIFGGNSKIDKYVFNRIKNNKITFEYSERLNKRKPSSFLWVKKYLNMLVYRTIYKRNKLYLLSTGMYAAGDFNEYNMYQNKSYKWGYFPEFIEYDIEKLLEEKEKSQISFLWAGRLIDWKHPDLVIKLAKKLKEEKYNFTINIIGNGEMENEIKLLIENENLQNEVYMCGSMSPEKVREYMEESNIYLFTSDYQEGWGAVLNEAMNSGCAVVASHAAGSTGYLIKNEINGLIFESENFNSFYKQVKLLLDNKERCKELGKNAYNTIKNTWNSKVAAERFLKLAKCLENGNETPYNDGPCSVARPCKNKNAYKMMVNK